MLTQRSPLYYVQEVLVECLVALSAIIGMTMTDLETGQDCTHPSEPSITHKPSISLKPSASLKPGTTLKPSSTLKPSTIRQI